MNKRQKNILRMKQIIISETNKLDPFKPDWDNTYVHKKSRKKVIKKLDKICQLLEDIYCDCDL